MYDAFTGGIAMRLFIAVNCSEEMKSALTDIQQLIRKQSITGNYTKLDNFHLTLAFIGEYDRPDRASEALERVCFEAFQLSLNGIGAFGDLWWAGISDNDRTLE